MPSKSKSRGTRKINMFDPTANYTTSIAKFHKARHGKDYLITGDALDLLDGYANYFVASISDTAKTINAYRKAGTFTREHAAVATKLVLPGKLGARAAKTGQKAVEKFLASVNEAAAAKKKK